MARAKYIWIADGGKNMCEACAALDGTEYQSLADIPEKPHPNCKCVIKDISGFAPKYLNPSPWTGKDAPKNIYGEPIYIAPDGNRKVYSPPPLFSREAMEAREWKNLTAKEQEKKLQENNTKNFNKALQKTIISEGGFTDGKNQVKDQQTNMGIQQITLDKYNKEFPNKNFPKSVADLLERHAVEIYKTYYWDRTRIPDIKLDRIRDAVFDMNVMSSPRIVGETVQKTLNYHSKTNIKIDGIIGSKTIEALNSIPENKISSFMEVLKFEREKSLQKMPNWPTAKGGWKERIKAY